MGRRSLPLLILLSLLGSCGGPKPVYPPRTPPDLGDAGRIAAGRLLFLRKCASCHGAVEEGRLPRANSYVPPPPDFTAPAYREADPAYLYWRIETGNREEPFRSRGSVMPAWGPHFSEEEIWSLVAYVQRRGGKGVGGEGKGPQRAAPSLASMSTVASPCGPTGG